MVQYRDGKPNRRKKIQRGGVSDNNVKGVAERGSDLSDTSMCIKIMDLAVC